MRHDAKFDLRIVGRDNHFATIGDERFTHLAAFFRAHRNVLQIGITRSQAPRHGRRLTESRVHTTGTTIDHQRKLVGIGTL